MEPTFDNVDGFFNSLPALTEQEIRHSNRLRIPAAMRNEMLLKKLAKKKEETAEYEKKILA